MNKGVKDSAGSIMTYVSSPDNFSNILANQIAQQFLLEAKDIMDNGEIFEFIYSTQVAWAEEMKERRKKRREYLDKNRVKHEPSFLDTILKEHEYYDNAAKDVAIKAMFWLDEVRNKPR